MDDDFQSWSTTPHKRRDPGFLRCGNKHRGEACARLLSLSARRLGPHRPPRLMGLSSSPEVDVVLGNCSCVVGTSLYPAIAWVCGRRCSTDGCRVSAGAVRAEQKPLRRRRRRRRHSVSSDCQEQRELTSVSQNI